MLDQRFSPLTYSTVVNSISLHICFCFSQGSEQTLAKCADILFTSPQGQGRLLSVCAGLFLFSAACMHRFLRYRPNLLMFRRLPHSTKNKYDSNDVVAHPRVFTHIKLTRINLPLPAVQVSLPCAAY